MESIYNRIKNAMTAEGTMPEDFVLRPKMQDGRQFADGAIDGTIRYYMGHAGNTDIEMLTQALKLASADKFEDAANALITYFAQGIVMLPVMDKVQEWIYHHPQELSPENLGRFAMTLLLQSPDAESVKFALTVLEVLEQEPSEDLQELLLTLASCEELTLFCLFALGGYDNANDIYFQLAQKLKGWGRIHAISMLKATNEEIRSWLLDEGWQNSIMPEYSAITIIKRTKLADLLQQVEAGQDTQLVNQAGNLIGYALQEEPIAGLSGYKRAGELLQGYLSKAEQVELSEANRQKLPEIKTFIENSQLDNKWQLVEMCNNILG